MNRRGAQVSSRMETVIDFYGGDDQDLAGWYTDGNAIKRDLEIAMHGEGDPSLIDEGGIRQWQAAGREFELVIKQKLAAIGKAARKRGLTPQEAAEAFKRGEIDW